MAVVVQKSLLNLSSVSLLGALLLAGSGCGEDVPPGPGYGGYNPNPSTGGDGDGDGDGDIGGGNQGDGDGDDPGPGGTSNGVPCEVQDIVEEKCGTCHGAAKAFGAPMSLVSYQDFVAKGATDASKDQTVHQLVAERINETNTLRKMPPTNQPQLTSDELATLNAWLNAGAPAVTESCEPVSGGDGDGDGDGDGNNPPTKCPNGFCEIDRTGLDCYEFRAHSGNKSGKFKVGTAQDKYFNFGFTAPWTGTAYGVILRPIIDNTEVIHHWLLFQQKGGVQDGSISDSNGTHPDGDLVHGWAPGGDLINFRDIEDDVAFEFAEGDAFILEFHYNSNNPNAEDASGVEVCVEKRKPAQLAGVSWLGSDAIFGTTAQGTCAPRSQEPIHIMAVSPHMHIAGTHMKGIINRKDGTKETLHDAPFSFNDQTWYSKDVVLQPGDSITTTCTYNKFSRFGTETSSEMCYLFTVAYPKYALSDGGPIGTAFHGGGACLGL